jgi:hypothetical protein
MLCFHNVQDRVRSFFDVRDDFDLFSVVLAGQNKDNQEIFSCSPLISKGSFLDHFPVESEKMLA